MSEPQLIDDQEHERVFERVAAVDVAKAAGMVCTRGPHPSRPGVRQAAVWEVPATMNAVSALADQLAAAGVQKVTLESDHLLSWQYSLHLHWWLSYYIRSYLYSVLACHGLLYDSGEDLIPHDLL